MALPVARPFAHSPTEVIAATLAGVPLLMPRYSLTYDVGLGAVGVDAFAPSLSRRALMRRRDVSDALGVAPMIVAGAVKAVGGFIHGSSAGTSIAQQTDAYAQAQQGDPAGLDFLVRSAWWQPGIPGAPNAAAADDARNKLRALRSAGIATGTDNANDWRLLVQGTNPLGIMAPGGGAPSLLDTLFGTRATAGPAVGPSLGPGGPVGPTPGGFVRPAAVLGGVDLPTLLLVGLGAFVLSKVVK